MKGNKNIVRNRYRYK